MLALITYEYVDPVLTGQNCGISISTRRTNMFVLLVFMLMLTYFWFSHLLALTCAYTYAYVIVKTSLRKTLRFTIRKNFHPVPGKKKNKDIVEQPYFPNTPIV